MKCSRKSGSTGRGEALSAGRLIESGSHVPGVSPADFGLPHLTALRYELPAPGLEPFVADYHVLDSIRVPGELPCEHMLPNGPSIRIILAEHPMVLMVGQDAGVTLPRASLYGPMSRAASMEVGTGGVTVGITLTPAGLARLGEIDVHDLRDRVVPLDTVLEPKFVAELTQTLLASDQGPAVKAIFDTALLPLFARPHPQEEDILRITDLLATPGIATVQEARERLGMHPRRLERLSRRHFGFSPKLLFRRARLLRSIVALKLGGPPFDLSLIDPDYHDHSHFTRDSHRFLGMAPMKFLKLPNHYIDAALRARTIVRGAAMAALDRSAA